MAPIMGQTTTTESHDLTQRKVSAINEYTDCGDRSIVMTAHKYFGT